MKQLKGKFYEVRDLEDEYGYGGRLESMEQAYKAVERHRSIAVANGLGIGERRWLIVKTEWVRNFDDNGKFTYEETRREAIREVVVHG